MKRAILINFILALVLAIALILLGVDKYARYAAVVYVGFSGAIFGSSLRKDKLQKNVKQTKRLLITIFIMLIALSLVYISGCLIGVSTDVKIWSTIIVLLVGGVIVLYFAIKGNSEERVTDKL